MSRRLPKIALPAEVLEEIFSYLSRKDLVQVPYVCKAFTMSGGPILYRHINLRSDDRYANETVNFLRNNREAIGIKILSATITTRRQAGPVARRAREPWISPDFAEKWERLHSLELSGVPFVDHGDALTFFRSLGKYCPNLTQFIYRPGREDDQIPSFQLVGLKKVMWQSNLITTDLPVMPVMEASLNTLTHISFSGMIAYKSGGPYEQFLKLRFPHLISLELGSLELTVSLNRTKTAVTKFILAHPKIEHLSMGKRQPLYFMFQFDLGQLKSDSLPALKSFEGFPENIVDLVRVPVVSFFSISHLSLSCADEDEDDFSAKFTRMLLAFEGAQRQGRNFTSVQYLRCDFHVDLTHKMPTNVTKLAPRKWMDELWHWFPNVISWRTSLLPMTADHISVMFGMYEHLETISLPQLSLSIHIPFSPAGQVDYFRHLAERCRNLKTVIARKPDYSELEDTIYTLHRSSDKRLKLVTEAATREQQEHIMEYRYLS